MFTNSLQSFEYSISKLVSGLKRITEVMLSKMHNVGKISFECKCLSICLITYKKYEHVLVCIHKIHIYMCLIRMYMFIVCKIIKF